ncbi:MAG: DNA alkylation repair protein [Nanoarchaeota archaeon]|nr:DNA alkylation repair protein [Nanoarchaeota archaeon]
MIRDLRKQLKEKYNKERAEHSKRFFKTGKGEYGEWDVFYGLSVPETREIAKKYILNLNEIQELLDSEIHEERFAGLLILISKYEKDDDNEKRKIFDFYLKNAEKSRINNWDLVDLSCHKIVGDFLLNRERDVLYKLVNGNLWERRIAVVSCFAFIRNKDFQDILKLSELIISNKEKHDLIHKAVGWMLREVGKKDESVLISFLDKYLRQMPRTMLRYAIEKLDENLRERYMNGEIE